jgi:hypothetical protein
MDTEIRNAKSIISGPAFNHHLYLIITTITSVVEPKIVAAPSLVREGFSCTAHAEARSIMFSNFHMIFI